MIPDCTLVTACFSLNHIYPHSRKIEEYIESIKTLLECPAYLIVFTDKYFYEHIKNIRGSFNLLELTTFIVKELDELEFLKLNKIVKRNREIYYPTRDQRTCSESHLICCSKFNFVLEAMKLNPYNTKRYAWVDSNLGPNNCKIAQNYTKNMFLKVLNHDSEKFHIQVMNVCNKKFKEKIHKREMYEQYRWVVCGCFFMTGIEIGKKILNRLNEIVRDTTLLGFGHGEEMFYLEVLDEFYDDIERSYGDYGNILNNFFGPTINIQYINQFIINNYINYRYFKEGYECCYKLVREIENFNTSVDYNLYLNILFNYYICCYHFKDKEQAQIILDKINNIILKHPIIKNEYQKYQQFFDNLVKV
jgi:hypothetical protein